jgi:drug/metabolite transporter superfamily protein YnfA
MIMEVNSKKNMVKTILLISLMCFLTVGGQLLLKYGLAKTGGLSTNSFHEFFISFLKLFSEKYIYFGGFVSLTATLIFLIILSEKDLSFVVPVSNGIFYMFSFILSWIILGENITMWKISGASIILIGVSLFFK